MSVKESYIKVESLLKICIIEINCKLISKGASVSWLYTSCIFCILSLLKFPESTFSYVLSVPVIKTTIQPTRTIINSSCGWRRFVIFGTCILDIFWGRALISSCPKCYVACWKVDSTSQLSYASMILSASELKV